MVGPVPDCRSLLEDLPAPSTSKTTTPSTTNQDAPIAYTPEPNSAEDAEDSNGWEVRTSSNDLLKYLIGYTLDISCFWDTMFNVSLTSSFDPGGGLPLPWIAFAGGV